MILSNLSDCFTLWIPTDLTLDQLEYELTRQQQVWQATQDLLHNKISLFDAFDIIEFQDINMDNYVDEVEANVEEVLMSHLLFI